MRERAHSHKCDGCGVKTPCDGSISQNYDGWPEWICDAYHTLDRQHEFTQNTFLCEACAEQRAHEAEVLRVSNWTRANGLRV
jgi:hypothetical protein